MCKRTCDITNREKIALEALFEKEEREYKGIEGKSPYRDRQIFRFIKDASSRVRLMDDITFAADWFEHPNVMGRSPRGEADFQAIRLVPLYFECYDALCDKAKEALDRFFLKRDFFSFYESENHALMNRVSRYLASQFYLDKDVLFEQFDPWTPKELYGKDGSYLHKFLDFRVKRGWGEFDSYGYSTEILMILNVLYAYTKDEKLKKKTGMAMDIILLDMICDSKNGLYGGAHGRIYPASALDTKHSGMFHVYCYYFGERCNISEKEISVPYSFLLSGYRPGEIVYDIEKNRTYPYINRERKHLHSCHAWHAANICTATLDALAPYAINKQTYVGERYLLGGINRQDMYPENIPDKWYAHHQQHEWELTLPGGTNHKIFSHHPSDPGYHKQHNRWTGDLGCCCSTHYTNENTAVSLYNITNPEKYDYINAYVPFEIFDEVVIEDKYIFLKYTGLYISIYFSEGYRVNKEDEYTDKELISSGRQHAVVLRVEHEEKYSSMQAFIEDISSKQVVFDKENMTVEFDSVFVSYNNNGENGKTNVYPYEYLYDSPYMKSVWNSGVIELSGKDIQCVYDFNTVTVNEKK